MRLDTGIRLQPSRLRDIVTEHRERFIQEGTEAELGLKPENVKALSDNELSQVIAWTQHEQKARAEKRKQETIAKIKELAGAVGVSAT